jgi:hypothetical protein
MSADYEIVWENADARRFYVARNGEMRINARNSLNNDYTVIRYTDQLEDFGITNDSELREWEDKGQDYFEYDNNSWFEVCSRTEGDEELYEVFHVLSEAVAHAESLWETYGENGNIWEEEETN